MKIEKLPSGSYRVRKMVNGKTYSLTFDHRPTQKDIQNEVNKRSTGSYSGRMKFRFACEEYISNRSNTLSPASIKEYTSRFGKVTDRLLDMYVDEITSNDIQKDINDFAKTHSAKTTKNQFLFEQAVINAYRDDLRLKVTLPALEVKAPYIPKTDDIQTLINEVRDTQLELCLRLASLSLRRAEICALTLDDLEGNYLTINKSKVQDVNNNWVIKNTPKTEVSNRTIYVSDRIVELAHTVGFYEGNPGNIYVQLTKIEKRLGLPHFSIHKLRHYFASTALDTMPEADVQKFGGWSSDGAMKRIYRHVINDKTEKVAETILSQFD